MIGFLARLSIVVAAFVLGRTVRNLRDRRCHEPRLLAAPAPAPTPLFAADRYALQFREAVRTGRATITGMCTYCGGEWYRCETSPCGGRALHDGLRRPACTAELDAFGVCRCHRCEGENA